LRHIRKIKVIKTVRDLDNSYVLVSADHEIMNILNDIGYPIEDKPFINFLYVKAIEGEYIDIYGMTGSVPYLDHFVEPILLNRERVETY
jgi:hypothetical protein